ncbi:MAG: methyltransferase domain-containing protein [Phycisphaerae bacterium]
MNATRRHAKKQAALHQFERWSKTYDRSILQFLLFRPTFEILLEEVVRWRRGEDGARETAFSVLDVGCGTGIWASLVRAAGLPASVVGLDFSPEMCRRARERADTVGANGTSFVNADSEHLPFRDGSFDLVTCSHSFHHYPHQQEVVRDMNRVLRPGGRLLLVDGFRDNIIGWAVFDVGVTRAEGNNVYHVPWSEMRGLFADAGFVDVCQRKFNIWAPALLTMAMKADPAGTHGAGGQAVQ